MKDEYSAGGVNVPSGAVPGTSMDVDGAVSIAQTIQHHPPQQSFGLTAMPSAGPGTKYYIYYLLSFNPALHTDVKLQYS